MDLYGIKTCDTCRKARKALEAAGKTVIFHDIRETPLSAEKLAAFYEAFGDKLLNRSSTTWRGLDEAERATPVKDLLALHPTLMKRPVLEEAGQMTLGWAKDVQGLWLA
ncbi:ArsC/Spx/MgsR family protein [Thioclava sp. GXIMD4216]|uniref:ArsC/Spx/MgsR family protein n=1 Tax=Thioclava litoralis TaxID=3076557 RepID=A0ABZ1E2N5_9RHOB|nr:ArsC/Spx/MgsR family protein [Thioclava sp. FTW29]